MFTHPWNNRNTRFAPGAFKRTVSWRCWRKGSQFDRGDRWRRPLDRNDRARIMHCAEALERRTKAKHKRDGVLGQSALTLLRKLVFGFLNMQSGRLDPSYTQLMEATGFCKQTVAKAIKNLELAGILEVMRRIVRERAKIWDEQFRRWFIQERVIQTTNAYMVNYPLPDRRGFGDLATPLLRPEKRQPAESRFSTESTSRFNIKNTENNEDNQATLEERKKRALEALFADSGTKE